MAQACLHHCLTPHWISIFKRWLNLIFDSNVILIANVTYFNDISTFMQLMDKKIAFFVEMIMTSGWFTWKFIMIAILIDFKKGFYNGFCILWWNEVIRISEIYILCDFKITIKVRINNAFESCWKEVLPQSLLDFLDLPLN